MIYIFHSIYGNVYVCTHLNMGYIYTHNMELYGYYYVGICVYMYTYAYTHILYNVYILY